MPNAAIVPMQGVKPVEESGLFTIAWYLFFDLVKRWIDNLNSRVASLEAGSSGASGVVVQEIILTASQTIPNGAVAPALGAIMVVFVDQDATGGWAITWDTDFETDTPVLTDFTPLSKNSFTFVGTSSATWRLVSIWQPVI